MSGFPMNGGLKFGLNIPAKKATKPVAKPKVPSIFKVEDDEPALDFNAAVKADAERKKKSLKLKEEQQKAMEEDPTVYDYDGVYDAMQKQKDDRTSRINQQKEESRKKPKYIFAIKERVAERKVEQDIIHDRIERREQEKDAGEFGDLPKFVTKSYKEKLIKDKVWLEQEAEREAREEDVTQKQDLSGFYAGLLTKNVSMGAETQQEKLSKKKAEEAKKKKQEEEETKKKQEEEAKKKIIRTPEEELRLQEKKEIRRIGKKEIGRRRRRRIGKIEK